MDETTAQAIRAVRDACAAKADAVAHGIEMGADHLRDYDRGGLAAARHIGRLIRELELEAVIARSRK